MTKKRNLKLTVAYEGTNYAGFQRQAGSIATIQETIEKAILRITGEAVSLIGAGRTDSGVHARGQVVNFFSQTGLETPQWQKALNAVLPEDVAVVGVAEVPAAFHARFWAKSKTYSYRIHNNPLRPVFNRNLLYYYRYPLDELKMHQATEVLVGTHDFRSFQAAGSAVKTTVRTVNFCRLARLGSELTLVINANGFLYHMVRNIVGTLIMVGNGKLSLDEFEQVMRRADRNFAGPTAPAQGLCLDEVFYESW